MWPATTSQVAIAVQSWTNVAPVRHESGNGSNHRMIDPVASISGIMPAMKAALAFCPALNLPTWSPASWPRLHSHRRSDGDHRDRRRKSRRMAARHRPA